MSKLIELTKGHVAIVDDEDYERLSLVSWLYERGYARRRVEKNGKQQVQHLHRVVLGDIPEGFEVDHINGNPLDNRKVNLRIVTHHQNTLNMAGHKNTSSQYKGVFWDKEKSKWCAQIAFKGKRKHLGRFECEHEAAQAYNLAAILYFGSHARLNAIKN